MPRAKRALAEADPNASAQEPAPKKTSTESKATKSASQPAATGKENVEYQSQTIMQLKHLLHDRDLPCSGRKTKVTLIGFLEDDDKLIAEARKNAGSAKSAKDKASSGKAATTQKTEASSKPAKSPASGPKDDLSKPAAWKFVTYCRPYSDITAEREDLYDEDDDDENVDNAKGPLFTCGTDQCKCRKSLAKFPDWKWVITRKGFQMFLKLQKEAEHRDQDAMDQYHYNDFSGYGFQEVMDNHVSCPDHPPAYCKLSEPKASSS